MKNTIYIQSGELGYYSTVNKAQWGWDIKLCGTGKHHCVSPVNRMFLCAKLSTEFSYFQVALLYFKVPATLNRVQYIKLNNGGHGLIPHCWFVSRMCLRMCTWICVCSVKLQVLWRSDLKEEDNGNQSDQLKTNVYRCWFVDIDISRIEKWLVI